jgi:hypothetical protein
MKDRIDNGQSISSLSSLSSSLTSPTYPIWLIQASISHARCLLKIGQPYEAIIAAQTAVDLIPTSVWTSWPSLPLDGTMTTTTFLSLYESLEVLQQALEGASSVRPTNKGTNDTPQDDWTSREVTILERLILGWSEQQSKEQLLSTAQRNRRRSLGFRFQKLQNQVKK